MSTEYCPKCMLPLHLCGSHVGDGCEAEKPAVKLQLVRSPDGGLAVYLNDTRIVGPKPTSGNTVIYEGTVDLAVVQEICNNASDDPEALVAQARAEALEEAAQACEAKADEHRDLEAVFKKHGKHNAARVHFRYAQVLAAGGDSAAVRIRALVTKEPRK